MNRPCTAYMATIGTTEEEEDKWKRKKQNNPDLAQLSSAEQERAQSSFETELFRVTSLIKCVTECWSSNSVLRLNFGVSMEPDVRRTIFKRQIMKTALAIAFVAMFL